MCLSFFVKKKKRENKFNFSLQRHSIELDTPGMSTMTRLSVPTITSPGLVKSYGIKSVLNISLSSLFPSLSTKDQEPTLSGVRDTGK